MVLIIGLITACLSLHFIRRLLRLSGDQRYKERFAISRGYLPLGDAGLDDSNISAIVTDAQTVSLIMAPLMGMIAIGCFISAAS